MVLVPFEKSSANVYSPLERLHRDEALAKARRNSIKALGEIPTYTSTCIEDGPIRDLHPCNGKGTSSKKSGHEPCHGFAIYIIT